jgi:NADH-quinone oxidoreductase subunit M
MYQRTVTGPPRAERGVLPDLDRREVGTVAPLLLALVVFGFFPMPLLDAINPAVDSILQQVDYQDDGPDVPAAEMVEEGQQ